MYLLLSKFFLVVNWQPVAISVFRCAVKKPGNASFSRKKMKVFSHSQSQCRKVSANPGPAYISYPHWQFQTDCLSLKMLFCLKNNYKIISWKINNLHYSPKNQECFFFRGKKLRFFRIHNHNVWPSIWIIPALKISNGLFIIKNLVLPEKWFYSNFEPFYCLKNCVLLKIEQL